MPTATATPKTKTAKRKPLFRVDPKNKTQARRAIKVLKDAVNILETDGWTVGEFKCSTGKHCAVGALRAAAGHNPKRYNYKDPTYNVAISALQRAVGPFDAIQKEDLREAFELDPDRGWGDPDRGWGRELIDAFETVVVGYNDDRVVSDTGRKEVLAKFAKAIKALEATIA